MDRNEILQRNKQGTVQDEGQQYIEMQAKKYGEIGLIAFFIALTVYKWCKGLPANDLLAVVWGYLGVGYIYKYQKVKTKGALVSAICGIVAAVLFALSFVIQTW